MSKSQATDDLRSISFLPRKWKLALPGDRGSMIPTGDCQPFRRGVFLAPWREHSGSTMRRHATKKSRSTFAKAVPKIPPNFSNGEVLQVAPSLAGEGLSPVSSSQAFRWFRSIPGPPMMRNAFLGPVFMQQRGVLGSITKLRCRTSRDTSNGSRYCRSRLECERVSFLRRVSI